MPAWEKERPNNFDIVTGFFPETSPKTSSTTDPRPLLVCGTAEDKATGTYYCRVAYGTSQHLDRAWPADLVIGNVSFLNSLNLKKPTRFVLYSGNEMVILPWTRRHFQPWSIFATPVLSSLPDNMQRDVAHVLGSLSDLPEF